jgi:hypothetical protein
MRSDKVRRSRACRGVDGRPRKPGRPRIIGSPEEMDRLLDEYVALKAEAKEPVTLMGLILHLGLSSRESLDRYADRPEFADSVKKAKSVIAETYERRLHGPQPAGAIFALKNMGWSDRIDVDSRSLSANLDLSKLSDDQVRRLAAGEGTLSVLGGAAEAAVRRLSAGDDSATSSGPA